MLNARVSPEEYDVLKRMMVSGGFSSMYELMTGVVQLALHEYERRESTRGMTLQESPDEIEMMFSELTPSCEFIKPKKSRDTYFSEETKAAKRRTQYGQK